MIKYPISTLVYLAKLNIKDKLQDTLKLHNNVDAYIEIEVKDKNGNIIKRHKQHSHSFVQNFLSKLYFDWNQTSSVSVGYMGYNTGLQIGTGTTTPSPNDSILSNAIANGTGAGQMSYPPQPTFISPVVSGYTTTLKIQSTIVNNSGSPITVTEAGLIATGPNTSYSRGMMAHDLLSSPITVPNGTAITVTYIITVTT
jgi:PAB1-binding protein PBP1